MSPQRCRCHWPDSLGYSGLRVGHRGLVCAQLRSTGALVPPRLALGLVMTMKRAPMGGQWQRARVRWLIAMRPLAGGFQSALVISITGSSVSRCDNAQEAPTKDKGQGKKERVAVMQRGQHRKVKVRHPLFGPFSLVKIGSVFDCAMILVGKRIALSGVSFAG